MKRLFCLLLLTACSTHTQIYSSEGFDGCFIDFKNPITFTNYIETHEEYAENGNSNSMKLLGCAYYQKGEWLLAEKWLYESFNRGNTDSATALTAMYLKEGDIVQAVTWSQQVPLETDLVRWLKVLIALETYKESDDLTDLIQAKTALQNKINYEGETAMTLSLLDSMEQLIDESRKCSVSQCSITNVNDLKSHLTIVSTGALSTLIPSPPLKWNTDPEEAETTPLSHTT